MAWCGIEPHPAGYNLPCRAPARPYYPFARVVYAAGNAATHGCQIYTGHSCPACLPAKCRFCVLLELAARIGFWPGRPGGVCFVRVWLIGQSKND